MNTRVIITYRALMKRRRQMMKSSTRRGTDNENYITLVMIVIVVVFLTCQSPARLVQIVWRYHFDDCSQIQFYLIHISNILEVLNSSVNFLIYCVFHRQFRNILSSGAVCRPLQKGVNGNDINNRNVEGKTNIVVVEMKEEEIALVQTRRCDDDDANRGRSTVDITSCRRKVEDRGQDLDVCQDQSHGQDQEERHEDESEFKKNSCQTDHFDETTLPVEIEQLDEIPLTLEQERENVDDKRQESERMLKEERLEDDPQPDASRGDRENY